MAPSSHQGRLHGRTALITGASSGLGRAIAFAYAAEGAQICLVDLYDLPRNAINPRTGKADEIDRRSTSSPIALAALIAKFDDESLDGESSDRFVFVKADMTKPADVDRAVKECVRKFGRLDIMVNNAGISVESTHERAMKCHETCEEDFDKTMNINTKGVFLGCKYALKQMVEGQEPVDWDQKGIEKKDRWDRGWIVNTASIQGLVGYLGTRMFLTLEALSPDTVTDIDLAGMIASYCASKGAVVMLTKQIALDYAPDRIHCNALCPGCMSFCHYHPMLAFVHVS